MSEHTLRPMKESDLERVLKWRNHPDIRRYMYSTHEIDVDEHRIWFAQANTHPGIALLIYELDGRPCGFVNLRRTRCPDIADWGFYLAKDVPKGSGQELGEQSLNYAFKELNLHKVSGQVLEFNTSSISFHKRLGFSQEGHLRDQHFDGIQYHNVVCFGLLKNEWLALEED